MDTPEQFPNEDPDGKNVLLHVSDVILGVVIPGCAVLTLALIFLIWFKSDCLEPERPTDDGDHDGDHDDAPLESVKPSAAPEYRQDHCPPAYEAAGSYTGSAGECWANVRTVGLDESGGTPPQYRSESSSTIAPRLPTSPDTTCLKSKASSMRDASVV